MPTLRWEDVPAEARRRVEATTGTVTDASSAIAGSNSAVATLLCLEGGHAVFCKGAPLDSPNLWVYRNEARLNDYLRGIAPRLLWQTEVAGWLLLGFEHAPGRAADLSPGSPDLPRLAERLDATSRKLQPPADIPLQPLSRRWTTTTWRDSIDDPATGPDLWDGADREELARLEERTPDLVHGFAMAHTDMTPHNFLVSDDAVHLTDWSWPATAAPWVDTALLAHRLIAAGHTPAQAEAWAATVPAALSADEEGGRAVAITLWALWHRHNRRQPAPYRAQLADAARRWAEYRLR